MTQASAARRRRRARAAATFPESQEPGRSMTLTVIRHAGYHPFPAATTHAAGIICLARPVAACYQYRLVRRFWCRPFALHRFGPRARSAERGRAHGRPGLNARQEKDMTRTRLCLGVALVAITGWLATGCGGSSSDELVIGEFGSLTGGDATFGQSTKNGVQVALDELQAKSAGAIGGLKVRVVVEDDQGRAEEAATVVQKLVNQDRVVALLGEVASSRSLAGAPICQNAGVPMISPSSTNPRVTQVGDYIFRMCFLDDFQGNVMARFVADSLKIKKVAILKDVRSDYSVGLAQYFTQGFAAKGGTVVVEQSYSAGDQDFRAQLTAIKAKKPQAVIVPGYYTEAGLIARQ
ncbi:MAG: hypothetical protein E6K78_11995, partial [Candidatus Eisenbacteria bacterium]